MEDNANEKKKGVSTSSTRRTRHKFMKGIIIYKGWLRKRPRISGYWRNRYFVLIEYEQGKLHSFVVLFPFFVLQTNKNDSFLKKIINSIPFYRRRPCNGYP